MTTMDLLTIPGTTNSNQIGKMIMQSKKRMARNIATQRKSAAKMSLTTRKPKR